MILKEFSPKCLTINTSRGCQGLYKEMLILCKDFDVTESNVFFHKYGKDGKVFLIKNDPLCCGIDLAIENFQQSSEIELEKKNAARTSHDGLRLGCIMLDPQYCDAVSGIMSKKKDRKKADIPGDSAVHFFEKIVKDAFLNRNYVVSPDLKYYDEFPEDERVTWNPNDASVFEHKRTGEWLKETWDCYLRPKYKQALDRWNKDTGGGDGSPVSFVDYCGSNRWLVWLFCKDLDANFLLAGGACGRMPNHLQFEGGFTDISSMSESDNNSSNKRKAADELAAIRKQRQELRGTLDKFCSTLEKKTERMERMEHTDDPDTNLCNVAKYSQMMIDKTVLDTMSPDSKQVYIEKLKKERKGILEKFK